MYNQPRATVSTRYENTSENAANSFDYISIQCLKSFETGKFSLEMTYNVI